MGDDTPSTGSSARQILGALQQYAPGAIEAISKTLSGTAQGQLAAEQGVEPGYEDLYRRNQLATAGTEADVVEGPGGRLVSAADKYQRVLDPEYYSQRANLSNAINSYLGAYNPTSLSPTEEAQIARGINATTGPITPSAMNTVKNAQTFGDAGTQRWKNFGEAVSRVGAAMPSLKSGISGFDVSRTRGTNSGANNAATNAMSTNFGFSSSALGNITGAANASLAKRKDAWDQAMAGASAFNNVLSGVGSVIGGR